LANADNGGALVGNEVQWSLGTLPPTGTGTVSFTVDIASPLANGTILSSTATIAADLGLPQTDTATASVASSPLIVIVKGTDVDQAQVGDTIDFGIGLANFGNAVASDVTITDILPAELEALSADNGGIIDPAANTVTWNLGDLPPDGVPVILMVRARVSSFAPSIENRATISYAQLPQPFTLGIHVPVTTPTIPEPSHPIPLLQPVSLVLLAVLLLLYARGSLTTRDGRG
jgi:uncharacterized repeat protein (TIGR01451 family)